MFRKLSLHTALSREREYLHSMSDAVTPLLDHENTSVPKFACFADKNDSICFDCSLPSNNRTDCQWGKSKFLRYVNLLPFRISVHCCEISSFSFIDDGFCFFPSRGSKRHKIASPPECPKWAARCKWHRHEWRNKGRAKKLCWLAIRQSSGCQWPLQLPPCLEGLAKTFHCMNRAVLSTVIASF